jgi:hypothetical protein
MSDLFQSTLVLSAALTQLGARRNLTPPKIILSVELKGDFKVSREQIIVSASAMSKGDPIAFCNRILDCLEELNERVDREAREWVELQRNTLLSSFRRLYHRSPELALETLEEAFALENLDVTITIKPVREDG